VDFTLTPQQLELQRIARDFANHDIRPLARRLDRVADPVAAYPVELVRKSSELGLRTLKIPVEYGGLGADCLTEVVVLEELCAGDIGFGMTLQHDWREGEILARYTTGEQRARFLPEFLADPTYVTSYAITEPDSGSDNSLPYEATLAAGPKTRAELRGDSWVINGRKVFVSNGNVAKMVILWARTDPTVPWTRGISGFLVPTDMVGFQAGRVEDKLGIRLNQNVELIFDDCRIPRENLLGELNKGRQLMRKAGAGAKAKEGAKALGPARAVYEELVAWTRRRSIGGRPMVGEQLVQTVVSDMRIEIEMARTLTWRAAWAVDNGSPDADALEDMVKVGVSAAAVRVVTDALEVLGAHAALRDNPIEKLLRDSLGMLHAGSGNDVARLHLAGLLKAEGLTMDD
jgi:alkylation response protein AidB-like acyl-CoA dehydrogenase